MSNNDFKHACKYNDLKRVKESIEGNYINAAFCNNLGLILACENGAVQVVKYLLKNTIADPRARDGLALNKAVLNNHVEIVHMLLNDARSDPIDGFQGLMYVSKIYYRDYRSLLQRFMCDPRILHWIRYMYQTLKANDSLLLQLYYVYNYPVGKPLQKPRRRKAILKEKCRHISQDCTNICIGLGQLNLPVLLLVELITIACQPFANLIDFYLLWLLTKSSRQ